jgi:hypothetical protein
LKVALDRLGRTGGGEFAVLEFGAADGAAHRVQFLGRQHILKHPHLMRSGPSKTIRRGSGGSGRWRIAGVGHSADRGR